MRTLLAKDIAPFTKIIAKMELKESIKAMFKPKEKDENGNEINNGGQMISELIWGIIENYYKAEQDFFLFMADLNEKTAEEISTLPLDDFINLIKELFSEKNLSFFRSAVR
jgi:hypothetical protein